MVPYAIAGVGLLISELPGTSLVFGMFALTLAAAGACTALAAFWSPPVAFLSGAAAAAGIALINSLGNLAGFASTSVIGKMSDAFGSTAPALYLFGTIVLVGSAIVLLIPARLVNK
jgi:nitrate/nitrite transporter NarK